MLGDRWFAVGVVGTALVCLVCLAPLAVVALGVRGFSARVGDLDVVLLPVVAGFVAFATYRYRASCRRAP